VLQEQVEAADLELAVRECRRPLILLDLFIFLTVSLCSSPSSLSQDVIAQKGVEPLCSGRTCRP